MCDCASCSYTDAFAGRADLFQDGSPNIKGFDLWPRGKPAGVSGSNADYKAHQKHCGSGGLPKPWKFTPGLPPKFNTAGLVMPITPAPKWLHDWINRKEARPVLAASPSPTQPAKAEPHLPELDRQPEPAVIYAMPKSTDAKRPRGRPAMEGRRVVIKLAEEQIKRAEKLGEGNIAEGIRRALSHKAKAG